MNGFTNQQILGEYANMGFNVKEPDGEVVELCLKDARLATFPQAISKREIQQKCFQITWGIREMFEGKFS
jgi:hypothetical protein